MTKLSNIYSAGSIITGSYFFFKWNYNLINYGRMFGFDRYDYLRHEKKPMSEKIGTAIGMSPFSLFGSVVIGSFWPICIYAESCSTFGEEVDPKIEIQKLKEEERKRDQRNRERLERLMKIKREHPKEVDLIYAIKNNDVEKVKNLIKDGVNVNTYITEDASFLSGGRGWPVFWMVDRTALKIAKKQYLDKREKSLFSNNSVDGLYEEMKKAEKNIKDDEMCKILIDAGASDSVYDETGNKYRKDLVKVKIDDHIYLGGPKAKEEFYKKYNAKL